MRGGGLAGENMLQPASNSIRSPLSQASRENAAISGVTGLTDSVEGCQEPLSRLADAATD